MQCFHCLDTEPWFSFFSVAIKFEELALVYANYLLRINCNYRNNRLVRAAAFFHKCLVTGFPVIAFFHKSFKVAS